MPVPFYGKVQEHEMGGGRIFRGELGRKAIEQPVDQTHEKSCRQADGQYFWCVLGSD